MNEGFPPTPGETLTEAQAQKEIRRIISERWQEIRASWEEFREREEEGSLNPEQFLDETRTEWEIRHGNSEMVDTGSPFEYARFLLSLLVEKGAEWSNSKRAAVRRMTVGFIQRSLGSMPITEQQILKDTVLSDPQTLQEIGEPRESERKIIEKWLEDTVGRGAR